MEFCSNCGAIMIPNKDILECTSCDYSNQICPKCGEKMDIKEGILKCNSCGNLKNLSENDTSYKVSKTIEEHETVKELGEVNDMRSTIKETCPECGHDEAYYELKQTRSADEAPTRIFTCAKCKHTWRAYH
ncbi:transcription factor S [Methanobrevibacter sp.]|uniref:transcription factor S n=1 Tax=Methanobrevibacter sp. TaxID=66852 RepID=UPI0038654D13